MDRKILCKTHFEENADHYCEQCKEIICPHCALSKNHFPHINKIKSLEEFIKQKINFINDNKNFPINKTIELFHFILNYNSMNLPFEKNYLINSINDQIDEYIEKIIELKLKVKNIFSKKVDLISNVLKSSKNYVIETQLKILSKIYDKENKNDYLNKLNLCLEKIKQNKNSNDAIKFIEEYQNLIKDCFEDENDLNNKYNFYMAYKYLNEISLNFKNNVFEKLIKSSFQKCINQIEEVLKQLDAEEKKEYKQLEIKLNELNIEKKSLKAYNEQNNILKKNNDINENKIKVNNKKNELNFNNKIENVISNRIKQFEEKEIKTKEDNLNQEKKEKIINKNNIKENEEKEFNQKIKNENEKPKEEKEKEKIKENLENNIIKEENPKNNNNMNLNIVFEPPKIEGGKMTQEEINNLEGDEEEKFLKKESEKDLGSYLLDAKMVEKTEIEIARNIIDELDDRLDIQYYEGIKFPDEEEKGELNDNAILEDEEKKENNINKENNIDKENNADKENNIEKENNTNKEKEEKEKKEEKKIENKNEDNQKKIENNNIDNNNMVKRPEIKEIKKTEIEKEKKKDNENHIKNSNLNALFGVNVKQRNSAKVDEENIKKIPSINMDGWVNIDSVPKVETQNKDKINDKNKRKIATSNPSNFRNLFGVSAPIKTRPKDVMKDKEIEKTKENVMQNEIQKNEQKIEPKQESKEKNIIIEEMKIPPPQNKESIEKIKKLNNLINLKGGRNTKDYKDLFNSLTWEEKNYIEIIGLNSSESKVYVYNKISDSIESLEAEIKFPIHQSYVNVLPYVYFSGGKVDNKPITLIRRLRKINNSFKIEQIGNLKEARSHHTSVYIKSINSLIIISGSKIKTCEKFDLTSNTIQNFPSIKNAREKCGACLINNENLFIFFGYDKSKQKFETSVEKINIKNPKSWEVLLIIGDQNLLKRHSMSCIPFNFKNKKGIIITGGIGSLRNESDDTIFIDLEEKNVKKFNSLPFGSTFTNPNFIPLTIGVEATSIYNISNENRVISFNLENYGFAGIE